MFDTIEITYLSVQSSLQICVEAVSQPLSIELQSVRTILAYLLWKAMKQYRVPFYQKSGDDYQCPISSSTGHTFVFVLSVVDLHQVPETEFGIRFTDNQWFQISIQPPANKISIYSSAHRHATFTESFPLSLTGETNLVIRIHKADSKNYLTSVNEQFVNGMEGTAAPVAAAQVYQYLGPSRAGATFEAGNTEGLP
ncbi:hypothetical protein GALMADRAFT_213856 [Galerina marginata CBS 339.88]|uniref:Uncharacterized protein n=1 Tax=Galerina marginata (strain CBS 339.88) TaxID=685588 RepID=A0A067SXS9_GALM3|nr:hypothetical protein GALMADRAFT_213856 [Galerina marginata CBS 339.88]